MPASCDDDARQNEDQEDRQEEDEKNLEIWSDSFQNLMALVHQL